jgi:hypothetical protein
VRGKKIIWLPLIAILIGVFFAPAKAAPGTVVRVSPSNITGLPDDTFEIQLTIENGYDVYAWGIDIQIVALERVITPIAYTEGSYLQGIGVSTNFLNAYDKLAGQVKLGCSREGPVSGVSGDGVLATITMQVLEAGTSPIDLINVKLIDSYGNLMPFKAYDGSYDGPTVNLVQKDVLPSRVIPVGTVGVFASKVKNTGTVPLYARVRWDLIRDDGVMFNAYAGQSFWTQAPPSVYLYCNGYTGSYSGWGWTEVGDAPYLNAVGDGNYLQAPDLTNYNWDPVTGENDYPAGFPIVGRFDFENLALAGRAIASVALQAYIKYDYYDENNDIDTYARPNGEVGPTTWIGSEWGTADWAWQEPRWVSGATWGPNYSTDILTQEGIDAARIRYFMYWTADNLPHGNVYLDAIRLRVNFSPVAPVEPPYVIVEPGQMVQMPAVNFYPLEYDVGTYRCTVFAEYRYFPPPPSGYAVVWNRGIKITPTFKIFVRP